jgi:uncharacterized membrane protein
MPVYVYTAIKLLHIAAMSVWLGGPPIAVFGLRRSLDNGAVIAHFHIARLLAVTPIFIGAALTTVVTGGALVWAAGGLASVPPRILIGALLVLPVFAIGGGMSRPALMRLERHFAAGGDASSVAADTRRFLLGHRLEQALRITVLVIMVVRW